MKFIQGKKESYISSEGKIRTTLLNNQNSVRILDFREQMLESVRGFSSSSSNGLFINSCFSHCQSELPATWSGSPSIQNKVIQVYNTQLSVHGTFMHSLLIHVICVFLLRVQGIAKSVGDWYFGRAEVKAIDCPYPCDNTCRHII